MLGFDNLKKDSVYNIYIYSYSVNTRVQFPVFLTSYSDDFKSSWTPVTVLGKMDPISTYKNTSRTISVGFDVPNESIQQAMENMQKVDALIKGMYPVYTSEVKEVKQNEKVKNVGGTYVIGSPPIFRVKFANFISNVSQTDEVPSDNNTLSSGLLCHIPDFKFSPDVSSGFFISENKIYPKLIKVSLILNIIHENPLGNERVSIVGNGGAVPRIQKDDSNRTYEFPHKFDTRASKQDGSEITEQNTAIASARADNTKNGILG